MDFLDNVVKSSNAILQSSKERINNQFGGTKQATDAQQPSAAGGGGGGGDGSQASILNPQTDSIPTTATNLSNDAPAPDGTSGAAAGSGGDPEQPAGRSGSSAGVEGNFSDKMNSQFAAIAADAELVTQKTVKGARNIGNFLFSMGNKAGQTVMQTAKQVKQAVESTNILTDFTREQQEFIKEHGGSIQAGELPWSNCRDEVKEADMREQVLSLSQDRRNFVRNPPNDFQFDPQQSYPIALSLLKEDPNLGKMRFELVPKLISEDTFWRNYFYRVSLLKQMSERGEDIKRQSWTSSRSSSGEGPDEVTVNEEPQQTHPGAIDESITSPSYTAAAAAAALSDGASLTKQDTFGQTSSSTNQELESSESRKLFAEADDLKSKLRELNIGSFEEAGGQDENGQWEEELQKDLQEFELVSADVSALDEEALDRDIMEMKKNLK